MFQESAGSLQADEMQEKNQTDAEIMKYGSSWERAERRGKWRDALFGHFSGFDVINQKEA